MIERFNERFNGRIADVLRTYHFGPSEEPKEARERKRRAECAAPGVGVEPNV